MGEETRDGFLKRRAKGFGRVARRRIMNETTESAARETWSGSVASARDAIRPRSVDRADVRAGYIGRHEDGGVAQFRAMMTKSGVADAELPARESGLRRQALVMACAAGVCLLAGVVIPLAAGDFVVRLSGLVFGLFSLVFLAVAVRHDYAAWQIRARRFGGFREYLDIRWGDRDGNTSPSTSATPPK